MAEKRHKVLISIVAVGLVLGSFLINIKNIFTSCHIDAEYQVAMAYRILRGDKMFWEMWESHQTSAFLLAFFEWIFMKIKGTTTGIMVYANAVGVLCKTTVAFLVYGLFRRRVDVDKGTAFAILIFLLNAYPKDSVLPDFANQQIWFALLLMCCLILHFQKPEELKWLILGAICLCLEVLSYPSCVLVWGFCIVLFFWYSSQKKRDIGMFTGICVVSGIAYLLYFMQGKPKEFMENIYYIWSGDESHAVGLGERLSLLGQDFIALAEDLKYIAVILLCAVLAAVLCKMFLTRRGSTVTGKRFGFMVILFSVGFYILAYSVRLPAEEAGTKYHFFILYLLVECAAFACMKYLDFTERKIFVIGQMVGFGGFAATLLLSDQGLFPTLPYLIPNLCVCLIPLERAFRDEISCLWRYLPVIFLCAVILFRNFIYLNGWMEAPADFYEDSIFGANWKARYGPLRGIVNREGTYAADMTFWEWQNFVTEGDRVFVLSYPTLASTIYLYGDVEVCTDSTISTPTYSDRLFTYWEKNPEKYPNVVLVKYYDNSYMVGEYNEVIDWLMEDFDADMEEEGTFYKFYIKR